MRRPRVHYPDERAEALEHLAFAIGGFRDMKMQLPGHPEGVTAMVSGFSY